MRHRPLLVIALATLVAAAAVTPGAVAQTLPNAPSLLGQVPIVRPPPGAKPHHPRHPGPRHAARPPAAQPEPKPPAKPSATKPTPVPPKVPAAAGTPAAPPTAAAPATPDPTKGTTTGLKLPRWVALRSDEVNLRTGPGMQYPIDWQYHRRDLPVSVLREYEVWRLVETRDGTKGWVHQATLTGRRGFLVIDAERVLRAAADDAAAPVARLQPGVVGHIRSCESAQAWCEVQTGDYRGWLRRTDIWGVDPDEAIN